MDLPFGIGGTLTGYNQDDIISGWNGEVGWPDVGPTPLRPFLAHLTNLPPGTVPVSAGMGEANMIGGLSVPSGWTVAAPEIRSIAKVSPITNAGPAAAAPLEDSATTFNQMGLGGMAGQAMAGPPAADASQDSGKPVTHARLTPRVAGAAADGEVEASPAPRTVVTGVAAAIRDIAKQRDQGYLTEEEYKEQKKRLLEISVRHRPLG